MRKRRLPLGVQHNGKGWYEFPNGYKVRGREAVFEALDNGDVRNDEATQYTLQRLDFARQGGLQYGGDRDIYKVAGYKKTPKYADYWSYYDRHPIAGRIVDLPPRTTWRHAPEVIEPDQEDETDFSIAVADLADRLGLWQRLERVDRLSRIGRYGVLLIGVRGDDVGLNQPIERLSGPEDVAYLTQYSEKYAAVDTWVTDSSDERFGLPLLYKIDLSRGSSSFRAGTQQVHWTRIIHVAEDVLEDDVYGRPILKRVLNTIFNDEKVDAASAEAFWQLADRILQLAIDPEAQLSDEAQEDLGEAIQEIMHDLRRQIVIQGGELGWIGGESPDPTGVSEVLATKMAVGAGIPKRVLFGTERGELASSQDERNWLGSISERQETHAEPGILRPFLDRLIELGALKPPTGGAYDVLWPNLYEATEAEIAERNKATAEAAKHLTPIGGDPFELVDIDEEGLITFRPGDMIREEREALPEPEFDEGPPEASEPEEETEPEPAG